MGGLAWAADPPAKDAKAAPAPTASKAAPAASTPVGEVLVTAEKREQNLQHVAVAISAFSAKQREVQGIQSIQDITNFTPGLTYNTKVDRTSMRGISRLSNQLTADSGVAVYSDEFFTTSTTEAGRDTLFVDRVEVLRGPQGTLYGRNAIGGAINIISRRPSPTPYAEVRGFFGNFGYKQYEAAVSDTVADGKLGLRLAGYWIDQSDGYSRNLYPGLKSEDGAKNEWYVEGQVEWRPTENIDWWIKGFTQGWQNSRGSTGAMLFNPTTGHYDTALVSPFDGLTYNPGFAYSTGPLAPVPGSVVGGCGVTDNPSMVNVRTFCHDVQGSVRLKGTYVVDSHFIYHFPSFDFKYVAGYDHYDYYSTQDWDTYGVVSYQVPLNPAFTPNSTCATVAALHLAPCAPFTAYPQETLNYTELNRWYSHEITLSSTNSSRFQWIVGGFYFNEHDDQPSTLNTGSGQVQLLGQLGGLVWPSPAVNAVLGAPKPQPDFALYTAEYNMNTRSLAAYAQATWQMSDQVKLTGGVRYTSDKKSGFENYRLILANSADAMNFGTFTPVVDVTPFVAAGAFPVAFGGVPQSAKGVSSPTTMTANGIWTRGLSDTSDAFTGTARVEWTPNPDTLAYFSYSRGYKTFAFNAGTIAQANEAAPEFNDAYEIGLKKTIAGRLTLDAAVFYDDYQNAQVPLPVSNGRSVQTQFFNVPKVRIDGLELMAVWAPIDPLQITATYSLNETALRSGCELVNGQAVGTCFTDPADPLALLPGAQPVGPILGQNGGTQAACQVQPNPITCARVQAVKGNPMPQAPKNKIALNANYTWMFEPGNLTLSGSFIWKDTSYGSIFPRAAESAPSWDQVDARLIWSGNRDKYEVILYVKNLFDTKGYLSAGGGQPVSFGTVTYYDLTPPRLFGVELHYKLF
jgi:iron complex outermembrane receptor protein